MSRHRVYRREAWRQALAEQGIDNAELATEVGDCFVRERRGRQQTFADAEPALADLGARHRLGLVTNGGACLQREKRVAVGVAGASAAGLAAIWLNRDGRCPRTDLPPRVEIRGLAEPPAAIERL